MFKLFKFEKQRLVSKFNQIQRFLDIASTYIELKILDINIDKLNKDYARSDNKQRLELYHNLYNILKSNDKYLAIDLAFEEAKIKFMQNITKDKTKPNVVMTADVEEIANKKGKYKLDNARDFRVTTSKLNAQSFMKNTAMTFDYGLPSDISVLNKGKNVGKGQNDGVGEKKVEGVRNVEAYLQEEEIKKNMHNIRTKNSMWMTNNKQLTDKTIEELENQKIHSLAKYTAKRNANSMDGDSLDNAGDFDETTRRRKWCRRIALPVSGDRKFSEVVGFKDFCQDLKFEDLDELTFEHFANRHTAEEMKARKIRIARDRARIMCTTDEYDYKPGSVEFYYRKVQKY